MLTTIGFVFYQNTVSLQEALVWQKQTNETVSLLDETLTLSLDIEDGMRGFVLTGVDTYLDPFNRAKQKIPENIGELRRHAVDDPQKLEVIGQLEALLKEFTAEAERKVDLRKQEGFFGSIFEITSPKDKPLLDAIRASLQRLKVLEVWQLQSREKNLDGSLYRTIWILIISSVAGILSLALANIVVWREIAKRRSAETALTDANRGLEEKIEKRTAELQVVNERLLDIGNERELLLVNEKRARQEAEIANRLRDEFMATVSHELRTPLNSILGWARLIKGGSLDEEQSTRAVKTIIKNSETQNRLIEDLLDVARIISGKLELEKEPLEIVDVVNHAVESAVPTAEARNIAIHFQAINDFGHSIVEGDKNRLRQVFSNLLTNAIKFSHENGQIDVTVETNTDHATIEVVDEGVGISPEFLPVVFERFRQDTSGTRKNGGLGLGLAIVRNLVEMHGGSVRVSSAGEEKGAKFTVTLPLSQN